MIRQNDEAVSPVIGVMLMLVVTIIIAAVVSAFAGGLAGDQQKTPQVSLAAKGVVQGIEDTDTTNYVPNISDGWTAANGIEFEHMGGDVFSLNDINIQLESRGTKYTLRSGDMINLSNTCLPKGVTDATGKKYFQKIGSDTPSDATIAPGDKFMLYADGCYDSSGAEWDPKGKFLSWSPEGTSGGFAAQLGTKIGYMVIDRMSNRVITTGEVFFR
jgi:FlaG/FlaF family flagellin (archaellin)